MYQFDEKQYGRIYTNREGNVQKIKDIIKDMDEFEYGYITENLISVFAGKFDAVYNGKFDQLDLDELIQRCNKQNITCGIIKAHEDYATMFNNLIADKESIDKCIRNFYETGFWTRDQVLRHYNLDYLM
jgi:hypothetical protein